MGKVVDSIYDYFSDGKVPLSRKLKLIILVILTAAFIDNHYGISHTIINSYKVDYMMKLESAKKQFNNDSLFVKEINNLINIEHNRKGFVEKFYSLLRIKIGSNDGKRVSADKIYNRLISERNPGIHTLTGAFVFIMLITSSILTIIFSLLRPKRRNFDLFFWAVILIWVGAILTYYVSLFWALVDPICGKVWINYIVQAVTNIIILVIIVGRVNKIEKTKKKYKICSEQRN